MHRVRRCCALLLLLAGCRSEAAEPPSDRALSSARTSAAGARLVLEDSVQLEETDSTYIGKATGLAVDGTGEIFVADDFSARVLEFTPTGHFVRAYGRKGSGPGELQRPIAIVLLGDSAFAVGNAGKNSPIIFDRRTGEWVSTGQVAGYVKSGQQVGDSLWLGIVSQKRGTSLASWRPGADSVRYFGPVPAEYSASARLWSVMPQAPFTVWGDTTALGFAGVNRLFILDGASNVIDTLNPPVARRRGVPANLVEEYDKGKGLEHYTQLSSILMQVGRTSSGQLVLVHHDVRQRGDRFTATAYVSLISADREQACVDAQLPLAPKATPFTALVGDRIVVFEQVADDRDAAAIVKTYRIDDAGCDWVSAG